MNTLIKTILFLTLTTVVCMASTKVKPTDKNSFQVLCYHNVVDKITDNKIMNVTTQQLISHFKWLKVNGYNVIGIDEIIQARDGKKDLPKKAVLLTFDDGYTSFYTRVYPLLKLYNYKAVYALVGKWQETPLNETFLYGDIPRKREILLNEKEIKEMSKSGLVEFASHSFDSHKGILSNPHGNTQASLITHKYDQVLNRYESTKEYITRVENDIKKSSDSIYKYTKIRPRVIVWPYGAYNGIVKKIAKKYGMDISFTLDKGVNTIDDLPAVKRILIKNNQSFSDFYWDMQGPISDSQRSIFIDLDTIYDPNPQKADKNLGAIIEKIVKFRVSTIILKAYSDRDRDGLADTLYFPNSILPMRSDLLNRVAWQLQTRAQIEDVYVNMPVSSFEIQNKKLSLHNKEDQKKIIDIYTDMAKYSFFKGILFDNSKTNNLISSDDIIKFTDKLIKNSEYFSVKLKSAILVNTDRLTPTSNQNIIKFLDAYDYIFIDTKNSNKTISSLIDELLKYPNGLEKANFIFTQKDTSTNKLSNQMLDLILKKAMNIAYKPDNFLHDIQNQKELIKVFSLKRSIFK